MLIGKSAGVVVFLRFFSLLNVYFEVHMGSKWEMPQLLASYSYTPHDMMDSQEEWLGSEDMFNDWLLEMIQAGIS